MIDKQILQIFISQYPIKGKQWCIENLGMNDVQIRYNAQKFNLKSSFKFNPQANYNRGSGFRGKKRPEHSALMKVKSNFVTNNPTKYPAILKKISNSMKIAIKEGRVRTDNFKGHHHTQKAKDRMRQKLLGYKYTKARNRKILKTKMERYGRLSFPTTNTYSRCKRGYYKIGNKNIYFRSLWEANYALYLDFLIKQGQIKKWGFEVDTFWFEKIRRGVRSYTPDFKVFNNNDTIEYHEVKGWMDKKSKTKIKRMAKYYPQVKLVVIGEDSYKDIKNKLGKLLKFYE